jgi:hypothetical protein
MTEAADELTGVDLTDDERRVLRFGLLMWSGGPAWMTDEIARAIWFDDREDFNEQRDRLWDAIEAQKPLSPRDWHRALAATELGYISWVLGAAGDWPMVSGIEDHTALDHIRPIQKKLAGVRPWPMPFARPQSLTDESA